VSEPNERIVLRGLEEGVRGLEVSFKKGFKKGFQNLKDLRRGSESEAW